METETKIRIHTEVKKEAINFCIKETGTSNVFDKEFRKCMQHFLKGAEFVIDNFDRYKEIDEFNKKSRELIETFLEIEEENKGMKQESDGFF